MTLLTSQAVVAQQPPSYELLCNLRTAAIAFTPTGFVLHFEGASAGSDARAPAEGECAWRDRGWADVEPEELVWEAGEVVLSSVNLDRESRVYGMVAEFSASEANKSLLTSVFRAWQTNGRLRVRAYRDGARMVMTELMAAYIMR